MDRNILEEEIKSNDALILYFYSDRCAPCISLRPKVQECIRSDFQKIKLIFINSEKDPELAASQNVFAHPTLISYFQGKEFQRWSKYVSVSQIAVAIERPYQLLFEA